MKYCLKRQEIDNRDFKYVHEAHEHLPKKVYSLLWINRVYVSFGGAMVAQ